MSSNTDTGADMRLLAQRVNLHNNNMSLPWLEFLALNENGEPAEAQTEKMLCERYIQKYHPNMTPSQTGGFMYTWLDVFRRHDVVQKVPAAEFQSETRWELTPLGRQLWAHVAEPAPKYAEPRDDFRAQAYKLARDCGHGTTLATSLERMETDIADFKRLAAADGAQISMALYVRIAHPELLPPRENDGHVSYVLSIGPTGSLPPQHLGDLPQPVTRQERKGRGKRRASRAPNKDISFSVVSHPRR